MASSPDSAMPIRPARRGGAMADSAAVEEVAVWLEVNGQRAVTWMCTPELLEELAVGWLYAEGYVHSAAEVRLRPCATDLGFWAEVPPANVEAVRAEQRRPVLASGCGAVSTFLADPGTLPSAPRRGAAPRLEQMRTLFKDLFGRGVRYRDTGGIHAAALSDHARLVAHAEDIGRHNAVDKAIGLALLGGVSPSGLGLLVTGRISAELAFKAARAGVVWVATPSVPSTLAVDIARRSGMVLIGRAVSGTPHFHPPDAHAAD